MQCRIGLGTDAAPSQADCKQNHSSTRKAVPMSRLSILAAALIATTVAGCNEPAPSTSEARPVRTVTVEHNAEGGTVSLTGQIRAKDQVGLAFRLDGRMIERPVNVGDVVTAGQVVARLDPQNQQNSLRSAQADLASAEAVLTQARLASGGSRSC